MREILPLLAALATVVLTAAFAKVVGTGARMAFALPISTGLVVYIVVSIFLRRIPPSKRERR